MFSSILVTLPWPPTSNTYWRRSGHRIYLSERGLNYRNLTIMKCKDIRNAFLLTDRLKVQINAFPPDKRKRDLDNICKSCLDSLQHADVYPDDNQIDWLIIRRMSDNLGFIEVIIETI